MHEKKNIRQNNELRKINTDRPRKKCITKLQKEKEKKLLDIGVT